MNRELLLRVADHIDEYPDSFDLSWWAQANTGDCKRPENICDTFGCVAGWTVMLHDPTVRFAIATGNLDSDEFNFGDEAAKALELDRDTADVLFTSNRWWAEQMLHFGFEPDEDRYEGFDGTWIPLELVSPKAASTILRALANREIDLRGDWSSDF